MPASGSPFLSGGLPAARGTARSAVLVLHGGREVSVQPTSSTQSAVLRMLDMYVGLRRLSTSAAIYLLRYRVRGWNCDGPGTARPAPVVDARWALDEITGRHGDVPVAVLGHSMGGRAAFTVADDSRVAGVCALAPWLPTGEPLPKTHDGQRFVLAHGTADRTTSAAGSLNYARRLRAAGSSVARFELVGGRHALLDRPWLWHRFAVEVSLGLAGDGSLPASVTAALESADAATLRLPLAAARQP